MDYNPVGWFEIYVEDMDRAKIFYEKVFEVTMEKLENPEDSGDPDLEMLAFPMEMNKPGAAGALAKMNGAPAGGNSTLVYFSSPDCAHEEARIEEAGGKIERPKMSIGEYGFVTIAYDTEGNMFGIHSSQ